MHLSFNTNSINLFSISWPQLYYTRKREHDKNKFKIFSRKREHSRPVHLVLTKKTRSAAAGVYDHDGGRPIWNGHARIPRNAQNVNENIM